MFLYLWVSSYEGVMQRRRRSHGARDVIDPVSIAVVGGEALLLRGEANRPLTGLQPEQPALSLSGYFAALSRRKGRAMERV